MRIFGIVITTARRLDEAKSYERDAGRREGSEAGRQAQLLDVWSASRHEYPGTARTIQAFLRANFGYFRSQEQTWTL
jgi:hypothetical protein